MNHTDIWIIIGTATFVSTVGVFVVIRKIIQYTKPPVNVLHRNGDIELQEVIDPIQHINVRDVDLYSLPQYPRAMVNNHLPIRWGNPPRYSQLSDNLINSSLENNINLDFIVWVILFFISILIVTILIRKYGKEKILLISIIILFLKFGLLAKYSMYHMSLLIPFSHFEINFRDSFEWKLKEQRPPHKIKWLYFQDLTKNITELLNSFEDNLDYSMNLSVVRSYTAWLENEEDPWRICDDIIVNKESDPLLITQFIISNVEKRHLNTDYLLEDHAINQTDPAIKSVTVAIEVKI